jgi:hypothetical protein
MVGEGVFVMGALTSYCAVEDVLRLLAGYDTAAIGLVSDLRARVQELLAPTRCAVDAEAGRDFLCHLDDTVQQDGNGSGTLGLGQLGLRPIQSVRELTVAGAAVPASEYVCYGDEGVVRLRAGGRLGGGFPVGVQNVTARVDWGYDRPPADVGLAQAKMVAGQVLSEVAGVRGSVGSMSLGDYSVSYDAGGEHAGVIQRWMEDARRVARSYRELRFVVV